jgi:hypothetical protein
MINFSLQSQAYDINNGISEYNLWVHLDNTVIITHHSLVSYRLYSDTVELYNSVPLLQLKTIIKYKL